MRVFFGAAALAACSLLVACGVLLGADDEPGAGEVDAGGGDPRDAGLDPEGGTDGDRQDACASADTSSDKDNCGSCGHACGGGACNAGVCAPELVTKLAGAVLRLVAAGDALYAGTSGAQPGVFRIGKAPPAAALELDPGAFVTEELSGNGNIAVDPSGVAYWGTPNGLRRIGADAGPDAATDGGAESLSELGAPVYAVRIVDGRLHFAVSGPAGGAGVNTGHLASCALPLCTDVQISNYTPYPLDVIPIGTTRWWLGTDSMIQTLALRTTGAVVIGAEQHQPSRMVSDGQRIYWSNLEGLQMFTVAGRVLVDLIPAPTAAKTRVNGVVLDSDGTLYVTQQAQMKRCTITSDKCVLTVVGTGPGTATDVAVDSQFFYWGTDDGSIMRVRKP